MILLLYSRSKSWYIDTWYIETTHDLYHFFDSANINEQYFSTPDSAILFISNFSTLDSTIICIRSFSTLDSNILLISGFSTMDSNHDCSTNYSAVFCYGLMVKTPPIHPAYSTPQSAAATRSDNQFPAVNT